MTLYGRWLLVVVAMRGLVAAATVQTCDREEVEVSCYGRPVVAVICVPETMEAVDI